MHNPGSSSLHREKATDPAGVAVPPTRLTTAESATASTPLPMDAPPVGTLALVWGLVVVDVTTFGVVTVVDVQLEIGGAVWRMVSL